MVGHRGCSWRCPGSVCGSVGVGRLAAELGLRTPALVLDASELRGASRPGRPPGLGGPGDGEDQLADLREAGVEVAALVAGLLRADEQLAVDREPVRDEREQ